jgi:hypothetical protein
MPLRHPTPTRIAGPTRTERVGTRWITFVLAVAVVAAAVVAAVVAGTRPDDPRVAPPPTHASQSPTPAPASPTGGAVPVGDPPRISYIVGQTLYLGNRAQRGSFMEAQSAGRWTVAYRPGSSDLVTPVVFHDDRRVAVLKSSVGNVRLSPDGTKLAWFEVADGTDHLVLRDLPSRTDIARVPVDAKALDPDFYGQLIPRSVADDGNVLYTTDGRTYFSWHPGGAPVRIGIIDDGAPPDGFDADASYVTLNAPGTWGVWATDRLGHNPENPQSQGITDGATFEKRGEPASRFTVTFPAGGSVYRLMWESDTDALLDYVVDGEGSWDRYLRCSTVTRRCEYAPTPANPEALGSPHGPGSEQ